MPKRRLRAATDILPPTTTRDDAHKAKKKKRDEANKNSHIEEKIKSLLESAESIRDTTKHEDHDGIMSRLMEIFQLRSPPLADRKLYSRTHHLIEDKAYDHDYTGLGKYEGKANSSLGEDIDVDIEADAYVVKGEFKRLWVNGNLHISEELQRSIEERNATRKNPLSTKDTTWAVWTHHDLYTSKDASGLQRSKEEDGLLPEKAVRFWVADKMTSQLLLYRLINTFGMAPSSEEDDLEDYKQVWGYTLYWIADVMDDAPEKSHITFTDYKGWWGLVFRGGWTAEKAALSMIAWLCSTNVPHPYNYTMAGRNA